LKGSSPFGYAGQYFDADAGSYNMRAREYSPQQGRFASEDPQAPDMQVPLTINPYAYAGNMPTEITDPSGRGWVFPRDYANPRGDYAEESAIGGYSPALTGVGSINQAAGGQLQAVLQPGTSGFWVPVLKVKPACATRVQVQPGQANALIENANVIDTGHHMLWDIEHANVGAGGGIIGHLHALLREAQVNGFWAEDPSCNRFSTGSCTGKVLRDPSLTLGSDYPAGLGLAGATFQLTGGATATVTSFPGGALGSLPGSSAADLVTVQVAPGLLEYAEMPLAPTCTGLRDCVVGLAQTLVFNDFKTLFYSDAPWYQRAQAFVGVVGDAVWVAKLAKAGTIAVSLEHAGEAADFAKPAGEGADLKTALEDAFAKPRVPGCGCFPGDTGVVTPHGLVAIDRLHVSDRVLAEDLATRKVEPERVQAVIDDGIKPLMTVGLSDGSKLKVTTNHPFYVDNGPGITVPEWVQAGDLKVGDRLRTEDGRDVTVTALRYHTGYAHVYTLTVATNHDFWSESRPGSGDHDFFVGTARVLVHNSDGPCGLVAYGSTNLSKAVQAARIARQDRGGNYAAALLDDGTIVIGRSSLDGHAEEDLVRQAGNRRIVSLYSEREPCANTCAPLLGRMNITNVTWSWDWNGVDRNAVNAAIRQTVGKLFR
jgi:RHS repeat-associated protein